MLSQRTCWQVAFRRRQGDMPIALAEQTTFLRRGSQCSWLLFLMSRQLKLVWRVSLSYQGCIDYHKQFLRKAWQCPLQQIQVVRLLKKLLVAPEPILWIVLGFVCVVFHDIFHINGHTGPAEGLLKCVVHTTAARMVCSYRVVRHH